MKFADAYILARTKRKTRRVRTALVTVVSSLLFAVLLAFAFMTQGLLNSGKQIGEIGFNGRHLTSVSSGNGTQFNPSDQTKIETEMLGELRARGVQVNDQVKQDPSFQEELQRRSSEHTSDLQNQQNKKVEKRIRELASPSALYHFVSFPTLSLYALHQPDPKIDPFVTQAEDHSDGSTEKFSPFMSGSLEFYHAEADMFRTQVQEGQSTDWKPGQPYPAIVPYGYLEQLSDRTFDKVSTSERNKGYRELINKHTGYELPFCYRNQLAQDQLRAVVDYNRRAKTDKNASTNPVDVPNCANFDQKRLQALGLTSATNPSGRVSLFPKSATAGPQAKPIKLKIVGFIPSQPAYGSVDIITSILTSLNVLPAGQLPAIIPSEVVQADPLLKSTIINDGSAYSTIFADFKTAAEQKSFLDKGCSGSDCLSTDSLYLSPFGNMSVALQGVFKFVSKALFIAALVIMVIAGLMIMFTISKVIADSTKEIAVFRSLGARRRDIAQIYYTYGFMLAGSTLLVSTLIALGVAALVSSLYDEKVAQGLVTATGAFASDIHGSLIGFNLVWFLGIAAAVFVSASLGIAVPVLVSIRRKLITILREE